MSIEVLLIGGPAAGEVYDTHQDAVPQCVFVDDQHRYVVHPMVIPADGGAEVVYFALYGDMTIVDAIEELWAVYASDEIVPFAKVPDDKDLVA